MKRIGFLCLFCFWNTIAFGQGELPRPDSARQTRGSIPADDKAIRAIADEWKNQYNRGSAAQVASLYTDDAYYLTQHCVTGIVHPRDQIRAYVQRGVDARYRVDSIEVLATGCSGDLGYALTGYESTNGA
jgi:ketosteroid isomerase-like protein